MKVSFSKLPNSISKENFNELVKALRDKADKSSAIYRIDTYGDKFKIEVLKAYGATRGTYGSVGGYFKAIKTIYSE